MSQANVTTAGQLVVIDGREYTLSPPVWHDWEWLQNEMRGEFIKGCRAEYEDGDVPEIQEQRIRAQAFAMEMLGPEGSRWLATVPGSVRLTYALLRHKQPDIKLADVYRWLVFERNFDLKREAMQVTSASLPPTSSAEAPKKNPENEPTGA